MRQRRDGEDPPHPVDAPVALDAADPVRHVRRVIEVDERRAAGGRAASGAGGPRTSSRGRAASRADSCQTWLWQFMQTDVGGTPAYFERVAS